jgi:hypothetical protein
MKHRERPFRMTAMTGIRLTWWSAGSAMDTADTPDPVLPASLRGALSPNRQGEPGRRFDHAGIRCHDALCSDCVFWLLAQINLLIPSSAVGSCGPMRCTTPDRNYSILQ